MPDIFQNIKLAGNGELQRKKRQSLIQLLALFFVLPFVEAFVSRWWYDEKIWVGLNCLALIFPTMRWCFLDAREHNLRLGRFMQLLIIGLAAVGVPVWLLRSRGLRGLISIGWLLLYCVLLFGVNYFAEYVAMDLWLPHWLENETSFA